MSIREDKLIEDSNVGYNEDLEAIKEASANLMNEDNIEEEDQELVLLEEELSKFDKTKAKKALELEKKKLLYEEAHKNDKEFQEYLKILKDIENNNKDFDDFKKEYLPKLEKNNKTKYEGKYCTITCVMPYDKREFNSEAFYEDYSPDSRMYQKYVTIKKVKGNVKIKLIKG